MPKQKKLVIVESPTKAKTIAQFLGRDAVVQSSFGHVRDLPKGDMGVDTAHGFAPRYVIPRKSQKIVTGLKKAAARAGMVYFATDEDREGEAISWHLQQILQIPSERAKRIAFHEITKEAIMDALANPRDLDTNLVDAQQARRILDRLVGYELSPFLWHKIARGLSAGRVQSAALRLLVEREQEIAAFRAQEYWTIEAVLRRGQDEFVAKVFSQDGKPLDKFAIPHAGEAERIKKILEAALMVVGSVERKTVRRAPPPPYTTSTLQQEANRKLGFSAKQTMMLAQQLYEGVELPGEGPSGLITYMRTDSTNMAQKFLHEAHEVITKLYGKESAVASPRVFKKKSKLAQEAHEAIRPTEVRRAPEFMVKALTPQQTRLYDLIWRRAVATQMTEAVLQATTVDIPAKESSGAAHYALRATGQTIDKLGYLVLYPDAQREHALPKLASGDKLDLRKVEPKQHTTEPPPRYSDAALVKALEAYGIGRPSTYAPTIDTLIARNYAERIEGRQLKPTEIAMMVIDLLKKHFPQIVDYQFTAQAEDWLDEIAVGKRAWVPALRAFYEPFHAHLAEKEKELGKQTLVEETNEVCEKCGKPMIIRMGRFGKFMACSGFPECKNAKPINGNGKGAEKPTDEVCDKCGAKMNQLEGRYGIYLKCPKCDATKNIQRKVGVRCPQCDKGDIVEKRSKRGRMFYSCSRYPDCKFALWLRPTGEKCPQCSSLLVYASKSKIQCSNKECAYKLTQMSE